MFQKIGILTILMYVAATTYGGTPFKDNFKIKPAGEGWFLGGAIGTQFYVGDSDNLQSTGYRFSTAMEGSVGKWITPTIAARVQGTFARVTGGNINDKADAMNLVNAHVDFMFDALNLIMGVDQERKFTAVPFLGVGCASNIDSRLTCFSLNVGATALFRVSPDIHLMVELKGSMLDDKMDGYIGGSKGEGSAVLTAGFTYNF